MRLLQFLYDHPGAAYDAASGLLIIKEPEPMTLRDPSPNETPLCRYWRELDAALKARGKNGATYELAESAMTKGETPEQAADRLSPEPRAAQLLPARVPTHLNGFPVVAALPRIVGDTVLAVVCHRPEADPHPWVCWDAYRHPETGAWTAEHGDYCDDREEAIEAALQRTGRPLLA